MLLLLIVDKAFEIINQDKCNLTTASRTRRWVRAAADTESL